MKTLNINTTRASLDISSTRAQLDIRNNVRRGFRTKTTQPRMNVENQRPQMRVNWKKVWADRGIRSPEAFSQYTRQIARQMVQEAIQNITAQGDYFGDITSYLGSNRSVVGDWATDQIANSVPELTMSPEAPSPEIEWIEGGMKIEWSPGDVEIIWEDDFMPDITVTPYSVEIKLRNHGEVKITVNEDNIPARISGKNVDKNI